MWSYRKKIFTFLIENCSYKNYGGYNKLRSKHCIEKNVRFVTNFSYLVFCWTLYFIYIYLELKIWKRGELEN